MYLVKLYKDHKDKEGLVIHSPFINDLKLPKGVVNMSLGSVHDFSFSMTIDSPGWGKIEPLKTLIEVTDYKTSEIIFEGRVLQPVSSMNSEGLVTRDLVAESVLAYLVDSSQRHDEIHDTTIKEFFELIVNNHNKQVEPHKRFKVGRVTVTSSTDNVYRYLGYDNTLDTIKDKLIDRLGGFIQARRESDGLYLDYLKESDAGVYVKDNPIRLALNMQSVDYEIDPTEVVTRLVPLGESLDSEDEEDTDASKARLDIKSVNSGKDYLDDLELQKVFGIVERSEVWDDVTTPSRLKTNGLNFLRDQKAAITRFTVNAVNSNLLDSRISAFELGNYHDLVNPLIGLNEKTQIIGKTVDINSPQKSSLKIGDKFKTLSQYQATMKELRRQVIELKSSDSYQRRQVNQLSKAAQQAQKEIESLHEIIDSMNIEEIDKTLAEIVNQTIEISNAINSLGLEITDLELRTKILEDFMTSQSHTNHEQKLFNEQIEERLEKLEGDRLDG